MKIKELIVVEGVNDSKRLKQYFNCETFETHGLALNQEMIGYLKRVNETHPLILFLDPDTPGEKIRKKLNEAIPGLKNAFILKEKARTERKVGVEHAAYPDLKAALSHLITYTKEEESLSYQDFLTCGLNGAKDSVKKRELIARYFYTGEANAKTMFKRLNLLGIDLKSLKAVLDE